MSLVDLPQNELATTQPEACVVSSVQEICGTKAIPLKKPH